MPRVITRYVWEGYRWSIMALKVFQKIRIVPRHLQLAIRNDEEYVLVPNIRIFTQYSYQIEQASW